MRILCNILVLLFVTTAAVGQQINPVPDYIFRNSMSVGRNAPTDTSAYFSIGPRFGATRGFMPPMVVDTAAVTGTKRNGLLIYSIQRNSFLYWDSTGMRWSRIAANLDTLLLSTRAWRQKGIDSVASVRIGGSGTLNYVPKFSASTTLSNSQIFDDGSQIGINSISSANSRLRVVSTGTQSTLWLESPATHRTEINFVKANGGFNGGARIYTDSASAAFAFTPTINTYSTIFASYGTSTIVERMRIHPNGRIGVNTTTDAGYQFDVAGSMRNTTDAYFNTTSGETYIGTTSDAGAFKLQVNGVAYAVDGLRTGNPTGGTAATWKLGTVASVSPTSPNRTIEVDIGGTIYYIHAKTTND